MQVNNNINQKTFLILIIFSLILFLIFGGYTINNFVKTKDYVKVYASITEVGYDVIPNGSGDSSYENYIKVSYTYNNNFYTNKQRVAFRFNKKEGDNIKIYVNPKNPIEIRDNYITRICITVSLIIVLFNIFCIRAYIIRKRTITS